MADATKTQTAIPNDRDATLVMDMPKVRRTRKIFGVFCRHETLPLVSLLME